VLEDHLGAGTVEQVIVQTHTASKAAARVQAAAGDDAHTGAGGGKKRRQRVMSLELTLSATLLTS
jgi:hypothetical protein